MDSDYDCDRLDYVLRDAILTGVKYGIIDLDYLIENLTFVHDPVHQTTNSTRYLAVKSVALCTPLNTT